MREGGLIASDERVVVFDTGAGFKSEARPIEDQPVVPNDPDAWPAVIARLD
jgi:hypothetical protein